MNPIDERRRQLRADALIWLLAVLLVGAMVGLGFAMQQGVA